MLLVIAYIGKSQQCIKTCVQEHRCGDKAIKHVLLPNQATATTTPLTHSQGSTTCLLSASLAKKSITSYQPPMLSQPNPMCVAIKDTPPPPPIGLSMHLRMWVPSKVSNKDCVTIAPQPPIVNFEDLPPAPKILSYQRATTDTRLNARQENCSALACHLVAYMKHLKFNTKAEVAELSSLYQDQHTLALKHHQSCQNGKHKSLPIVRGRAHHHLAKFCKHAQMKDDSKPQEWTVWHMQL